MLVVVGSALRHQRYGKRSLAAMSSLAREGVVSLMKAVQYKQRGDDHLFVQVFLRSSLRGSREERC